MGRNRVSTANSGSDIDIGMGANRTERSPKLPIRVLVAVTDLITGEFITETLRSMPTHFKVRVLIGSAKTIFREVGSFAPHVTLLSDELEDEPQEGLEVLRELKRSASNTAVVMLLKRPNPDDIVTALRLGARGIVYRSRSFKSLPRCLQTVHQGQIWVGNEDVEHILDWLSRVNSVVVSGPGGSTLLTSREQDVVRLVADGMKNREIAHSLSLTEHSVRNYLYRIFNKLGVSSRAELMLYALSPRGVELRSRLWGRNTKVVPRRSNTPTDAAMA